MHKFGTVVLAHIQFTDTFELKKRPAVILYEEYGNIVVAGITSNTKMKGLSLTTKDGAIKNSIIKLNYIFTISQHMIEKKLFTLPTKKKIALIEGITSKMQAAV
ncbi:MAG: type II toxin-antitoxin system PemK/MazF family toxin [Candidatus Woesearchaeota archaeon]|nr:type II toxin-antitoxin system PemK/MazF family toxin [Candidatus Woesearchaeota archaeon]